ncbi:MAG: MerR family transcriptional regulator [Herbiconiux sp.]|nr:MerR family transcriptional regulator [Herbiconiux sp.]
MFSSFTPPRQVTIGGAAAFVGTTPRAIRHYHQIGLLPEPERGSDDRRRYGYDEMIRLLWIRRMADAGIALDDIRDAFADAAGAGNGTAACGAWNWPSSSTHPARPEPRRVEITRRC